MPHAPSHIRMAYLVSAYPALSHTFILREVLGLKARGIDIVTASINPDARPMERLTADERSERELTYVLKSHGLVGGLKAHAWTLLNHPAGYINGLRFALRRGGTLKQQAWNLFHLTEAFMIGKWMNQARVEHLHVHFGTAAASVASLARKVFPITLSMTVHGPDEFANVREEHFAEKVEATEFVVCISHFARGQTMQHSDPSGWHKLDVVRLGIFPDYGDHTRLPHATGTFEMACVGRLTPAKGQHLLIEALHRLQKQGVTHIRLTLAGNGPDEASLRQHAQEMGVSHLIHFAGPLNQHEVRELYARSDAFVLPSFAEGIPVVLMEAMSFGLPCLSTRTAGIPELIEDGVSGFLVAPSDVDGLAERMRQLATDQALCESLGQAGRQQVLSRYNLEHNIDLLAATFRRHLSEDCST